MEESKSTICRDLSNALRQTKEYQNKGLSYIKLCYEGKYWDQEMVHIRYKDGKDIRFNATHMSALEMLKRILNNVGIEIKEFWD